MPSPMQNIETRLTALETKIDELLARPQVNPEVNLEGTLALLGQILGKVEQIQSAVAPTAPVDLNAQAQQAIATLQAIQAQLQQQVAQTAQVLNNQVEPELLEE